MLPTINLSMFVPLNKELLIAGIFGLYVNSPVNPVQFWNAPDPIVCNPEPSSKFVISLQP